MTPVIIPKTNENQAEATLDRWDVKDGDNVGEGQVLCHLITDKNNQELHAPQAGTVRLLASERSVLPVGFAVCTVGAKDAPVPPALLAQNEALQTAHKGAATAPSAGISAGTAAVSSGSIRATPAARRMAKEQNIELADIVKTLGLTGPVNEKDIKRFLEQKG